MRKTLAVIVPVSDFEPLTMIFSSICNITSLNFGEYRPLIVYVIDTNNLEKISKIRNFIENKGLSWAVKIIRRSTNRGKRAGAINDALDYVARFKPKYIAIFDIDTKPETDFIVKCVNALEKEPKAYIASSRRYILNPKNLVSETVEIEYYLLNFLIKKLHFKQFNGLIGVLRSDIILKYRLDEAALTEDADFATRMHAAGLKAILVDSTKLFEQSPITWRDLLNQRKRWYFGGLQLWKLWKLVKKSKNRKFIASWILSLSLSYIPIIAMPLIFLAPFILLYKFKKIEKTKILLGLLIHTILLQCAAVLAIYNFIRKKEVEWKPLRRE